MILGRTFASFLTMEWCCDFINRVRFIYFTRVQGNLNIYSDESYVLRHPYSIDRLKYGRPSSRILKLILPLLAIDEVEKTKKQMKVLCIGARFEAELLYLVGYGFSSKNIKGFDMISYSPWIDAGNMHAMQYSNNTWDSIIAGWVISYSDNPKKAAEEMLRVIKNGGYIAVGVAYDAYDKNRTQTVKDILQLFKGYVKNIYYQHDSENQQGSCCVIFSITK